MGSGVEQEILDVRNRRNYSPLIFAEDHSIDIQIELNGDRSFQYPGYSEVVNLDL